MPESKSGALPLGDIPMSGSGPCIGHTGHCITKSPFWQAFFSKTLRQKALEFFVFLCYNTQHSIRGIGISVLCGLPKAKRRVRLPYPAPFETTLRGGFSVLKKLRRICRFCGKHFQIHFPPGRVPGGKYFSGCKCGICLPMANKLCAQQTAKTCRKAPTGDFRQSERGSVCCTAYGYYA